MKDEKDETGAALRVWRFSPETLTLNHYDSRGTNVYEVDLERCTTSAQMLDWIMQVAMKRWATDRVLASLVHALDAVLKPQARLCGLGVERGPINVKKVLRDRKLKEDRP
jgi:hypothetical protein